MPAVGRPKPPKWKWLATALSLYGFLGCTRRALGAWLKRHDAELFSSRFAKHPAVTERARYCDLGHEQDIEGFAAAVRARQPALLWITGVGGAGKSALAFEVVRRARSKARRCVLPIVVDEDWDGPLQAHVAALLRVGNRQPTPSMIETLGVAGRLLVIVDSLSERGTGDAVERVGKAARGGAFLHLVVTARGPAPDSASFQDFATIETRPLTPDRLPDFVAIYAPEADQNAILEKLGPLIDKDKPLGPL